MDRKDFLINLFEEQCEVGTPTSCYLKHSIENYSGDLPGFEIEITIKVPEINEDGVQEEYDNYERASLYVVGVLDSFFIGFNSFRYKLTSEEYWSLMQKYCNKQNIVSEEEKKDLVTNDEKLLNLIFSQKVNKEKRGILLEKQADE